MTRPGRSGLAPLASLVLLAVPAHSAADGLRKGPYLQNVSRDAITVMFETAAVTQAVVRYGPTREYGEAVRSGPARLHEVRLEGLEPSTLYHYQVEAGRDRSPDRRFSTAAGAEEPFRFLLYGDNRGDHDAHATVVQAMLDEDADLALNTGDMVSDGSDEGDWQVFFDVERRLLSETTMYPAIGNHEAFGARGRALFRRWFSLPEDSVFPEQDYAFTFGNARFVVLTAYEEFPRAQLDWIERELDRSSRDPALRHRFVMIHHGPYSSGYHGGNVAVLEAGLPALLRDGRIDVVFSGHDHDYERGRISGLNYVVSGGGGAPIYDVNTRRRGQESFEAVLHYVRVDVIGDSIELTTLRPDRSVVDRCNLTGPGAWRCPAPAADTSTVRPSSSRPTPVAASPGCRAGSVIAVVPLLVLALIELYARVRRSRQSAGKP